MGSSMQGMNRKGALIGIGVGPGDPDLITVKGLAALRAAPVLAYPGAGDRGKPCPCDRPPPTSKG